MITVAACVLSAIALALSNIRFWRVAQREHYIPGSVNRFESRWRARGIVNVAAVVAIVALTVLAHRGPTSAVALLVPLIAAVTPVGLSLKGRTGKLVWTKRMKSVAIVTVALQAVPFIFFFVFAPVAYAVFATAFAGTVMIDLALRILQPIEKRKAETFVAKARKRLQQVSPTVVGITGSYGKTSTKNYLAHLLTGSKTVLPTPASFNNRAGLSRTINEQLSPGTEVFIAEMGTYGPGEIRELCEFVQPEIAMITAIGPVHLERFVSEEAIVTAKSEIFENAKVCILNVDDERLARLADQLQAAGKQVLSAGSVNDAAYVRVVEDGDVMRVIIAGEESGSVTGVNAPPTNLACAIVAALGLGVTPQQIIERLPSLPVPQHRQSISTSSEGFIVIDDTYNANPASVRRGVQLLAKTAGEGKRRVVATPGIVELGPRQATENKAFAAEAGTVATDIVVIGRTNRKALVAGASSTGANVVVVDRLPQAVEWMRQHMTEGDAVLYANDLPDHFP